MPIVRTVLNPLPGALGVRWRVFLLWQVIGGAVWAVGLTVAGHLLGTYIPGVDKYLLPVVALVVIVSLLPLAIELVRERRRRRPSGSG